MALCRMNMYIITQIIYIRVINIYYIFMYINFDIYKHIYIIYN